MTPQVWYSIPFSWLSTLQLFPLFHSLVPYLLLSDNLMEADEVFNTEIGSDVNTNVATPIAKHYKEIFFIIT